MPGKLACTEDAEPGDDVASMEPRLGCRGNIRRRSSRSARSSSFNGAPAWMPGKQDVARKEHERLVELQWSPGLDAGETHVGTVRRVTVGLASMEPRLGCRGNMLREAPGRAATMLQWSPGLDAGETRTYLAMDDWGVLLQWSPGLDAGETRRERARPGRWRCFNGAPAWMPGKRAGEGATRPVPGLASMEPRLGCRGNLSRSSDGGALRVLQWSPGLDAGETGSSAA